MKNIAVLGCTLSTDNESSTATITSTPSLKCIADGKAAYLSPINVLVTYSDAEGYAGVSTGSINSSSQKCKVGEKFVMLEGDSATVEVTAVNAAHPLWTPKVLRIKVEIDSAGQNKARGN